MENHALVAECDPLISELLDHYQREKDNKFAERVCKTPESIRSHLKPTRALWGAMTLSAFTKGSKQRVKLQVEAWREAGLKQNTVRARISHFKTAIKYCFDEELVPESAKMPLFKMPASGPPRQRAIDEDRELPALLAEIDKPETAPHVRLAVELLIRTGQRKSAVCALRWRHVDFERRAILFRETEKAEERSKKRRTNMPMDDELYRILMDAKARATCDAVIEWRGKPVKDNYYAIKRLFKRAGVSDLWLHDCRRSSATYVNAELDGDITKAAEHIGDTVAMAKKHYVQDRPETRLRGVEAVSSVMDRARASCPAPQSPTASPLRSL